MSTLLIFGASGFIGANLLEYFDKQNCHDIICVSHTSDRPHHIGSNIEWLQLDLTNKNSIDLLPSNVDCVLQFSAATSAGTSLQNKKLDFIYSNAMINSNILHYVAHNQVDKFIFPSCSTVYQSSVIPAKESDIDLNLPFFRSYRGSANVKSYIEQICSIYSELLETKFTVLRHSNLFGPHDKYFRDDAHVCASLISKALLADDNSSIEVWGDGTLQRDLLYVEDFCQAVGCLLDSNEEDYAVFNVGSGNLVSIDHLAKMIIQYVGKNLMINYTPSSSTGEFVSCLDISKMTSITNWAPNTSLELGIQKSVDWVKSNCP